MHTSDTPVQRVYAELLNRQLNAAYERNAERLADIRTLILMYEAEFPQEVEQYKRKMADSVVKT